MNNDTPTKITLDDTSFNKLEKRLEEPAQVKPGIQKLMNNDMPERIELPKPYYFRKALKGSLYRLMNGMSFAEWGNLVSMWTLEEAQSFAAAMNVRPQAPQSAADCANAVFEKYNIYRSGGQYYVAMGNRVGLVEDAANLIQAYAQQVADAQCAPLVEAFVSALVKSLEELKDEYDHMDDVQKYQRDTVRKVINMVEDALDAYRKAKGE